jgi:hypothetical protein
MALVALTVTRVGSDIGRFQVHADYGDKGTTDIMCGDLEDLLHTIQIWVSGDWSQKPDVRVCNANSMKVRTEASLFPRLALNGKG